MCARRVCKETIVAFFYCFMFHNCCSVFVVVVKQLHVHCADFVSSSHIRCVSTNIIICVVVVTCWFLWIDNQEHFFGNLFASSQWRWQLRYWLIINNIDFIHLRTNFFFLFDNVDQHHKYSKQLRSYFCFCLSVKKQKRPASHFFFSLRLSLLRCTSHCVVQIGDTIAIQWNFCWAGVIRRRRMCITLKIVVRWLFAVQVENRIKIIN